MKENYRPLQKYLNTDETLSRTYRDDGKSDENDNDNRANEELDSEEDPGEFRRQEKVDDKKNCTDDFSKTGESSSGERNKGNPYTVFKGKYKQNWLWNHFMDGDHMNINPYGPQFNSLGPSGTELFFNRKWWYFNQDDFKPFR
ncbi:uncharacterized protein LOC126379559 [Pectinophora gossypiella]|uniref:uncharacterized protein LOC126379559 n=1 Tax=Pectinophora gossypiella TaxID=13191 RepID=UPI00214E02B5|nr:uncharacterized protein LOC126379559 [Pectinophora gossypiella]